MNLPMAESQRRLAVIRALLREHDLDAALLYYDELNIANGWYLSGWCPQFESGMVLVPREGEAMILGGPESEPFARADSAIKTTRNVPAFMVPEEEYPNAVITSFEEIFAGLGGSGAMGRIGLVGRGKVPLGVYEALKAALGEAELHDLTEDFESLRVIKSEWEIETIRSAFRIVDEGFAAMREAAHAGATEFEVAAAGEAVARRLGANWFGFKTIVAAGERANGVVPTASERTLREGDMVLAGLSCRYRGYCGVAGDTLIVGVPTEEQREVLRDLAEAFFLTRDMLVPGRVGTEVDRPARELFRRKGYLDYLVCPFAHTIGLNEAEAPFFGPNSRDELRPGMCVCVDVSFFGHPQFNGVRVESGYEITEGGPKPFSPRMEAMVARYREGTDP